MHVDIHRSFRASLWLRGKESTCQCRKCRRCGLDLWVRKIHWSRKWQPTPVFSHGKFQGQRSLAGYSPWGCKQSDTTEQLNNNFLDINTLVVGFKLSTTSLLNSWKYKLVLISSSIPLWDNLSQLCATLWTMACHAPLSLPLLQARILEWAAMPSLGDLPDPGIKPESLMSPALAGGFFTTSTTQGSPKQVCAILFSNLLSSLGCTHVHLSITAHT